MLILGIVLEGLIFPFGPFDFALAEAVAACGTEVALLLGGTRSVGFNAEAEGAEGLRAGSAGFVLVPVDPFDWERADTETPMARAFVD